MLLLYCAGNFVAIQRSNPDTVEINSGSGEKAGSYFGSCWSVRGGGMEKSGEQITVVFALI
jgi:hypothetical protein